MRRNLEVKHKDLTSASVLGNICKRNIEKYGDKHGPFIDWLCEHKKSWDDIIESATRPGEKDFGF